MIVETFKTPILHLNLQNSFNFKKKIKEIKKKEGRIASNLGGYQSHDLEKNASIFLPLLKTIEKEANYLAEQIGIRNNLKINNFWINVNSYKNTNMPHSHPHSILSGSFYVKIPKDSGLIVFRHPISNLMDSYWINNIVNFTEFTSCTWRFTPNENDLLIFPSWLEHYVEPNMNKKEERISIAFNLS